jgi:hypothetical protein
MDIVNASPRQFFGFLIDGAVQEQGTEITPLARQYLVGLLTEPAERIRPDVQTPLALRFLRAQGKTTSSSERRETYRRIGDDVLLLCGFWWQNIHRLYRPSRDLPYHVDLGRLAYSRLDSEVFHELAVRLPDVLGLLMRVSMQCSTSQNEDVLRLVGLWQQNQSRLAASLLARRGVSVTGLRGFSAPS